MDVDSQAEGCELRLSSLMSGFYHLFNFYLSYRKIYIVCVCVCVLFIGASEVKESTCNAGDPGSIPGLGTYPRDGNGNRGAWWATVHGLQRVGHDRATNISLSLFHAHTYIHTEREIQNSICFLLQVF